ncbi:hypothetical protein [Ligilactobacillus salitolerans]
MTNGSKSLEDGSKQIQSGSKSLGDGSKQIQSGSKLSKVRANCLYIFSN